MNARLMVDCKNTIGECCFWDPRDDCLWWTDIQQCRIYRLSNEKDVTIFNLPDRACFILPRINQGFIIGFPKQIVQANQELTHFEKICDVEADLPYHRLNDADVDPYGGIVFGSYNENPDRTQRKATASVYRLSPEGTVMQLISGIRTSNGTAFSADGSILYFADTADGTIRRFQIGKDFSTITELTPLADTDVAPGLPDGSTVDCEENYWNARVWGSCVARLSPQGELNAKIDLPVAGPTCVAIGGKNLNCLYITSLSIKRSENDPLVSPFAGGLFMSEIDIAGSPQRLCTL